MNIKLITKNDSKEIELSGKFELVKWKLYTKRMQRNPFMKKYMLKKYGSICQWCHKRILKERFLLYHIDYAHQCVNETYIEIPNPTEKRPNKVLKVPDCEKCFNEDILAFNECAKRVAPVHSICNMLIEKWVNNNGKNQR